LPQRRGTEFLRRDLRQRADCFANPSLELTLHGHGAALIDPASLLEGSGKYMRHVRVEPGLTVDSLSLEALIRAAYLDIGTRLKRGQSSQPSKSSLPDASAA